MPNKKYRIVYESKLYNASETMEILKKCSPDDLFRVYHKKKKGPIPHPGDDMIKKSTLSQRMNRLEIKLDKLVETVDKGFKQVNARIDKIEARLDYNGLQIEQINERLDYNGLKKLPESK